MGKKIFFLRLTFTKKELQQLKKMNMLTITNQF